jgi:hypothetical protein
MNAIFNNMVPDAGCGFLRKKKIQHCCMRQLARRLPFSVQYRTMTVVWSPKSNDTDSMLRHSKCFFSNSCGIGGKDVAWWWLSIMPDGIMRKPCALGSQSTGMYCDWIFFQHTAPN